MGSPVLPDPERCPRPDCRGKGCVIESRARPGGYRYRRHECLTCAHRWSTYQSVVSPEDLAADYLNEAIENALGMSAEELAALDAPRPVPGQSKQARLIGLLQSPGWRETFAALRVRAGDKCEHCQHEQAAGERLYVYGTGEYTRGAEPDLQHLTLLCKECYRFANSRANTQQLYRRPDATR